MGQPDKSYLGHTLGVNSTLTHKLVLLVGTYQNLFRASLMVVISVRFYIFFHLVLYIFLLHSLSPVAQLVERETF